MKRIQTQRAAYRRKRRLHQKNLKKIAEALAVLQLMTAKDNLTARVQKTDDHQIGH